MRFRRRLLWPGTRRWENRRGNIMVLSAAFLIGLMGFAAFAVDVGYIAMTRTQLQGATDGSALAAALELGEGLGPGTTPTQQTVAATARTAGTAVAAANPAGDKSSVYLSTSNIEFGKRSWNGTTNAWTDSWGTQPYNIVRVTAIRGGGSSGSGDAALPLFFAPIIGSKDANLTVSSKAALLPGSGFKISSNSNSNLDLLPIAYDEPSWNALLAGSGNDDYSYNTSTGAVTSGSDGIHEIDLYPYGNQSLTSGNRGTVDIGSSNNSTSDISRQIRYGVNAQDLAYLGGSIEIPTGGSISLNGDTGISAGIKDDLTSIIGQPRAIPIFRAVTGPGNNAQFTIVKFVGIRLLYVKLTGGSKRVDAQPAPFISEHVISGTSTTVTDYVYTKPKLVN